MCVFGCGFGEYWCFDLNKVFGVEKFGDGGYGFGVQYQGVLYFWVVQVEVVVFQLNIFSYVFVFVEFKRWCFGGV